MEDWEIVELENSNFLEISKGDITTDIVLYNAEQNTFPPKKSYEIVKLVLPIYISIIDYEIKWTKSRRFLPYVSYITKVTIGNESWIVSKRYSSFLRLYNSISDIIKQKIAGFPKKYIHSINDREFLDTRKKQLSNFIKDVSLISTTNEKICMLLFMNFLVN